MTSSTKELWLSVLRSVMTLVGAFTVGHNLIGHAVDSQTWEIIAGSVLGIAGIIWGIVDKTTGPEQLSSAIRSVLIGLGGVAVSWGLLSDNTLQSIIGVVVSILPIILSQTAKATVKQVVDGTAVPVVSADGKATGKVSLQQPPKPDQNVVQEPKKP